MNQYKMINQYKNKNNNQNSNKKNYLNKKIKIQKDLLLKAITPILLTYQFAVAGDIVAGIKSLSDMVARVGMAVSVISFMAAGLMYLLNKNLGSEKLSGAILGTILIASASGLSSMIYSMFS